MDIKTAAKETHLHILDRLGDGPVENWLDNLSSLSMEHVIDMLQQIERGGG